MNTDLWRPDPAQGTRYRQGYLSTDPLRVVRVRTAGRSGFLTVKGKAVGVARPEFEYAIPLAHAEAMLDELCVHPLVEKTRYCHQECGRMWDIDVFQGVNAGLVVAEVELNDASATLELPAWVGDEVSGDARYFNSNLSRHPYSKWSRKGHGAVLL